MTGPQRQVRYGAALALVIVGVACGALIRGATGGTLATALVGLGLLGVVSLIFYEVGLSEDRDRARDVRDPAREDRSSAPASPSAPRAVGSRWSRPRRPDRMRGQRRRLR